MGQIAVWNQQMQSLSTQTAIKNCSHIHLLSIFKENARPLRHQLHPLPMEIQFSSGQLLISTMSPKSPVYYLELPRETLIQHKH